VRTEISFRKADGCDITSHPHTRNPRVLLESKQLPTLGAAQLLRHSRVTTSMVRDLRRRGVSFLDAIISCSISVCW
jgi:hypothetical protein